MKREYLDMYSMIRVCDMPVEMLNGWLLEELENLYRDFGQTITDIQLKYEANRLKEIITAGKYRTWFAGDVHSSLQSMIDGRAGEYRKVTIKSIQAALVSSYKIRCEYNRTKNDLSNEGFKSERSKQEAKMWLPYIKWWLEFNVDPDLVTVDIYNEAVLNKSLSELTDKWKNSRIPGPLFTDKSIMI